jgi:mannose-6-phosphate isomerase
VARTPAAQMVWRTWEAAPMAEQVERPWGSYNVLADEADFKVKKIQVRPGKRLSYQRHSHRAEHWFVVSGTGHVVLDGKVTPVNSGSIADVPKGAAHRIENTGNDDLVFIEVQHGDSFEEEDIVRLEDDFGRIGGV